MSSSSSCVTCKNKKCTESCDLCQKTLYCSNECKLLGQAVHQDNDVCNIIELPCPNIGVLVPYYQAQDNEQSYIARYINPKGFIEVRYIEDPIINTEDAAAPINVEDKYNVTIDYVDENMEPLETWSIKNLSKENTVVSKTSKYKQNKDLATHLNVEAPFLWIKNQKIEMPVDSGILRFQIGNKMEPVVAIYDLTQRDDFKAMQRKMPIYKVNQIKYGFNTVSENITTYQTNNLRATFDGRTLIDLEYHPSDEKDLVEKISFSCDANNLESVTGLLCAIHDRIADGTITQEHIMKQCNVISTYRDQLEKNPSTAEQTPQINAAIKDVSNALWEEIGRAAFKKRLEKWNQNIRDNIKTMQEKRKMDKEKDIIKLEALINIYISAAERDQRVAPTTSETRQRESGQNVARAQYGLGLMKRKFLENPEWVTANPTLYDTYNGKDSTRGNYEILYERYQKISDKEDEITNRKKGYEKQRRQELKTAKKEGFVTPPVKPGQQQMSQINFY